jgi:hypothetical protein
MQEPDRHITTWVCSLNFSFEALLKAVGPIFENHASNIGDKQKYCMCSRSCFTVCMIQ